MQMRLMKLLSPVWNRWHNKLRKVGGYIPEPFVWLRGYTTHPPPAFRAISVIQYVLICFIHMMVCVSKHGGGFEQAGYEQTG